MNVAMQEPPIDAVAVLRQSKMPGSHAADSTMGWADLVGDRLVAAATRR